MRRTVDVAPRGHSAPMGNRSIENVGAVSSRWEPCATFAAESATSPVCADCGWLATEHDRELLLAS